MYPSADPLLHAFQLDEAAGKMCNKIKMRIYADLHIETVTATNWQLGGKKEWQEELKQEPPVVAGKQYPDSLLPPTEFSPTPFCVSGTWVLGPGSWAQCVPTWQALIIFLPLQRLTWIWLHFAGILYAPATVSCRFVLLSLPSAFCHCTINRQN